jgi:hypothetical protein
LSKCAGSKSSESRVALGGWVGRQVLRGVVAVALLGIFSGSNVFGQETTIPSGPEDYKIRFAGEFWFANPQATLSGSSTEQPISFDKTLGFTSYSTFSAGLDWHFKRKQHLFLQVLPNQVSRTAVLGQTITFRDITFEQGSSVNSTLRTYYYIPGYRYDILHGRKGHLGIAAQFNLMDIKGTITGVALTSGSIRTSTATGSVFAAVPVLGPDGRMYFANGRVFVDANVKGMYFFGYGNYISTAGLVGVNLSKHIGVTGGYQLGSRLAVNSTNDRIGVRMTQRGPTAGMEFSF